MHFFAAVYITQKRRKKALQNDEEKLEKTIEVLTDAKNHYELQVMCQTRIIEQQSDTLAELVKLLKQANEHEKGGGDKLPWEA